MTRLLLTLLFAAATAWTSFAQAAERKIEIQFDAPATNYGVKIVAVYKVGEELWSVAKVYTLGDVGGSAITTVSDEVTVEAAADLPVLHKVIGRSWNWGENSDTLQYIEDPKGFKKLLKEKEAELLWRREQQQKQD